MKYLMIILILITGMSCAKQMQAKELVYYINSLEKQTDANTRRITWLTHQDTIKNMRREYPEDIKRIQPLLKPYYTGRTPSRYLIPLPLYEDSENGRLYLYFNPITGINDFYIEINKDQEITVIDPVLYRANKEFLGKWRQFGFNTYDQGKKVRNKYSYILYMLK